MSVLNRYLMETRRADDLDALATLPLFMSVRAAIRAKVTAARQSFNPADKTNRTKSARLFSRCPQSCWPGRRLFWWRWEASRAPQVAARSRAWPEFLPAPGALWLRSDVERKAQFAWPRPTGYRRPPTLAMSRRGSMPRWPTRRRRALAAGHSVIVDAVFCR